MKPKPDYGSNFWRKVWKTDTCWAWLGAADRDGYGVFTVTVPRRTTVRAHRWAWESERGTIPSGLQIDHLCRTSCCVRPDHMEVVTQNENVARGVSPTALNARKTHCKYGHPFTPDNTYQANDHGGRGCKTCKKREQVGVRARRRARRMLQKEAM